jgi:hypothetical protein
MCSPALVQNSSGEGPKQPPSVGGLPQLRGFGNVKSRALDRNPLFIWISLEVLPSVGKRKDTLGTINFTIANFVTAGKDSTMPTTSDTTTRGTTAGDDTSDALEGVYNSLRSGEATGEEAIAATIHAFTDLLRAGVPVAMSQPARFVDLSFELAQQAINFQRRFFYEVLSGLQRVMTEAWSDLESDQSHKSERGRGAEHNARTARRAA